MDFHADIRDAKVIVGAPRHPGVDVEAPQASSSSSQETKLRTDLPPDILVLTLDSGYMAFVYARNCSQQGQVDFVVSKQRIDSRGRHPTHLGKSVAVDPRSRAMAVTAYQDSFRLYSLRPMSEIQQQMAEGRDINPIKAEKSFEVKGLILHMEFLYPSPNDPEHVILLLFLIE
ncbi:hypothetical protein EX30DRAFT_350943 [Ascodesmis nigricans]|uniref:RSE1/DDB1/CPSF1 first beta-propeller domain-containing protein n=1 Tax=Ascodesmis nigricans TaxID=341454 RepID=A0A4S2MS88_9PEZI|nr:hypothetical protein EX30DRAFT_350943 [Ascodesmis nigricans]